MNLEDALLDMFAVPALIDGDFHLVDRDAAAGASLTLREVAWLVPTPSGPRLTLAPAS